MTILWPPSVEGHTRSRRDGPDNSAPARQECVVRWEKTGGDAPSLTAVSREACINQAQLVVEQPPLTAESIRRGPGGPHAISGRESEYCQFIPYKMHLKSRGKSKKFWCYRTHARGQYYNDRYVLVPEAAAVSAHGFLVDRDNRPLDDERDRAQRPEILKVKYTTGGSRGREVYTEVAVHRFLWMLGFRADQMFRTRISCAGCSDDPFADIRTAAENHPRDQTTAFDHASIERKAFAPLDLDNDKGWDWEEVYSSWSRDPRRRTEFEAYVLALNIVHFHHGISKQNSLACDLDTWDQISGRCLTPVIFLDDPGSSFGGGQSRGDYGKYRENTVFLGSGSCDLRADLAGFGRPSEEARTFLVKRLDALTPDGVRALFESSGFDRETTGELSTNGHRHFSTASARSKWPRVASWRHETNGETK